MSPPLLSAVAAASALRQGGVLILATDTVCGLHACADQPGALARLVSIKGRAPEQPLLVLCASFEQARALCAPLTPRQEAHCRAAWPGPFTFILPAADGLPSGVCDHRRMTIAIRVPGRADLRLLIGMVGAPLASTSANLAGEPPLADPQGAAAAFADRIDGWWLGDAAAAGTGSPSALVDLTVEPPAVRRAGPLPLPNAGSGRS